MAPNNRTASNQPSYDLFTGESATASGRQPRQTPSRQTGFGQSTTRIPSRPPSRQQSASVAAPSSYRATSRESSKENMAPPDAEEYETQRRRIEQLKADVGTLQYKVNTFEQEKEMARLQHDTELREARRKAEDDFKQRQAAEAERAAAERKIEALQTELDGMRGDQDARQKELERKLRDAHEEARLLQEQLEDLNTTKDEAARRSDKRTADLQAQIATAQRQLQEHAEATQAQEAALHSAQAQLAEWEAKTGQLETEILRLKAQTGDAATMEIIRRELKDQVSHIRALEATNREQLTELRHLRQAHKAVEIVEEEKRSLVRKLESAQSVEQELAEERMQRQRLEAEHRSWAAYLQTNDENGQPVAEFDSPESLAKALMEERYRTAELTERLGAIEPEMAQREADVQALQAQKKAAEDELQRVRASSTAAAGDASGAAANSGASAASSDKVRARLERQRALAVKEVEYLRAQLRAFDTEDITFHSEQFDQQKADRIKELEDLVDQYRTEAEALHKDMSALESASASAAAATPSSAGDNIAAGAKRAHPDDDIDGSGGNGGSSEQIGQLARKTRKLQDELSAAHTAKRVLETELAVVRDQLAAEKQAAGVRVLSLRANPTSDFEAVKRATLEALQKENAELLAHVQGTDKDGGRPSFTTVPMSVLAAGQREIAAAQAETASAQKTARRLKEVWAAKSAEFKEAVESTLGWHVTFIPNGKMRVESVYCPSQTDENEKSIVFDGERGTMKVGGGPRSAFAQRIDDQIRFWVRDKGCIPGFLAALTLEFYEEQARSGGGQAA